MTSYLISASQIPGGDVAGIVLEADPGSQVNPCGLMLETYMYLASPAKCRNLKVVLVVHCTICNAGAYTRGTQLCNLAHHCHGSAGWGNCWLELAVSQFARGALDQVLAQRPAGAIKALL